MLNDLNPVWRTILAEEFEKDYFLKLQLFINLAYKNNICYPESKQIFSALNCCLLANLKVVIIGQDPYHGAGEANGLCFSVNDLIKIPPSLKNIFKEISSDLNRTFMPESGNLERWAAQGVLMLNATLTVEQNKAGSHQKQGWEEFTDAIINKINSEKSNVVFLLWGNYAHKKGSKIDGYKHLVLKSGHPSPLSANQGKWFGNRHFSTTNAYLKSVGKTEIDW